MDITRVPIDGLVTEIRLNYNVELLETCINDRIPIIKQNDGCISLVAQLLLTSALLLDDDVEVTVNERIQFQAQSSVKKFYNELRDNHDQKSYAKTTMVHLLSALGKQLFTPGQEYIFSLPEAHKQGGKEHTVKSMGFRFRLYCAQLFPGIAGSNLFQVEREITTILALVDNFKRDPKQFQNIPIILANISGIEPHDDGFIPLCMRLYCTVSLFMSWESVYNRN